MLHFAFQSSPLKREYEQLPQVYCSWSHLQSLTWCEYSGEIWHRYHSTFSLLWKRQVVNCKKFGNFTESQFKSDWHSEKHSRIKPVEKHFVPALSLLLFSFTSFHCAHFSTFLLAHQFFCTILESNFRENEDQRVKSQQDITTNKGILLKFRFMSKSSQVNVVPVVANKPLYPLHFGFICWVSFTYTVMRFFLGMSS